MKNYENGEFTRRIIIDASKKLFYEKGFADTSYADICKEAHVNRSTIYYHFKNKEEIRYEIQWEYIIEKKRFVESYCPDSRYHYILAICLFWKELENDESLRTFIAQYCADFPIYAGGKNLFYFYYTLFDAMWGNFWPKSKIPFLSFTTAYPFMTGCLRLLCENPTRFHALEMFVHCMKNIAYIWEIPHEITNEVCTKTIEYLQILPGESLLQQ